MVEKTRPRNYRILRKLRTKGIRELNNIFVLNELSSNALLSAKKKMESDEDSKLDFSVPSVKGDFVTTTRKRTKIISLLHDAIDEGLAKSSIVSAIAITENFLAEMLRLILRAFPDKLKSQDKKVDLDLILDSSDLNNLVFKIVERQIHAVFFDGPDKYFQYIENTLSIQIPKASKEQYAEIKATRDLIVHNEGVINATYIRKAGKLARGRMGDMIPVDEMYFDPAIRAMKKLVNAVYSKSLTKFGDRKEITF
jgi:hypothetical protein